MQPKERFEVVMLDNFHFMDEGEDYVAKRFDTYDEAVSYSKGIIDSEFLNMVKPDDTAETLLRKWSGFSETPFVRGPKPATADDFRATEYVKSRVVVLTQNSSGNG